MPSLFESISIPVYEAFQAGTPVVASNILSFPEQVGDAGLAVLIRFPAPPSLIVSLGSQAIPSLRSSLENAGARKW